MNPEDEAILFQETFDIIFQESMDMIFVVDNDGVILDSNIQALRYLGMTLINIQKQELRKFVKESKRFKTFLEETLEQGSKNGQFTFITKNNTEIPFHVSATLIKTESFSYSVLLCRDIQDLIDVATQRRFFFELFQHDILNNLHAEIGYLDFFKRLKNDKQWKGETAEQLLEKMRELMVRSIYLIQNANINLLLQEERPLSKQKVKDVINYSIGYLKNFFANQILAEVTHMEDIIILGDEYLYRIFVNLIVRMLEYTDEKVHVEIYVTKPRRDKVNIKLQFEGIILSSDAKTEILEIAALDRKKLDVAVTQSMLERYEMQLQIESVKRLGTIVGTRITISAPIFELE